MAWGEYPAEYNPKVHGPYDPARFYGKGLFLLFRRFYPIICELEVTTVAQIVSLAGCCSSKFVLYLNRSFCFE